MDYRLINADNGTKIISIEDDSILIEDEQSVLDIFMPIVYETGEARFIISKHNLPENFFNLSNKTAGNILQKVTTYRMKLAIVGDFSGYSSKALKSFYL